MKAVDIVILIVLVLGAIRGFQKGFLLELIGLVAFVFGILGAFKLMHFGVDILETFTENYRGLLPFTSFIIIFVVIVLLINLLGLVLKKTIDMTILGSFDDLAGLLAGLIKWAFSISFLIWLMSFFKFELADKYTEGALLYPFVAGLAPWLIETLSAALPFVKEFFDSAKEQSGSQSRQV